MTNLIDNVILFLPTSQRHQFVQALDGCSHHDVPSILREFLSSNALDLKKRKYCYCE